MAEEMNQEGPTDVSKLIGNSVSETDVAKLLDAGFKTIESVIGTPKKNLLKISGITDVKATAIHREAMKLVDAGFQTANEMYTKRLNIIRLTTGSSRLDALLGGGIETGSITEVYGEFRTGKTQLCHTLAVTCQLPIDSNGAAAKCLYIDTEGTFRPERIVAIANRFKLNPEETLNNIVVGRAVSTDHQMELARRASELFATARFGIVIVDSVMSLYRTDYSGRAELYERQQHLGSFLRILTNLIEEHGVAILLSNQVMDIVDNSVLQGDAKKAVGGNILAHTSTTRLSLRKGRGEYRFCKIVDSPCQPESEEMFRIGDGGICDEAE